MNAVLEWTDLSAYGRLKYPDYSIYEGDVVFLKGPSGSGKSTLFKLLNNTQSPSSGRIFYRGKCIEENDPIQLRRNVLLCSQTPFLFDGSIRNAFHMFCKYRKDKIPEDDQIDRFLKLCHISTDLKNSCSKLSGGEMQRIFIAACLYFSQDVLLLDEPTSSLDSETSEAVMGDVIKYCRKHKITCFVISHDESLRTDFSERTINLRLQNDSSNGE